VRISAAGRCAFGVYAAVGMLVGCSGPQTFFWPSGTALANASDHRAASGRASVETYARSLLYLTSSSSVNVYTFPRGKLLGSLVVGGSLCSDKFGNIVVAGAAGVSQVWVYPHGSNKPVANMYNPYDSGGCSVDPSSESIAIAGGFSGSVVVWPYNPKRGWRLAHEYNDPNMLLSAYSAYDPQGNLFLDGQDSNRLFMLAELPKGSLTFTTINLNRVVHAPGSLQWLGKYLAVEDAGKSGSSPAVIYRFAINGSSGNRVSTTTLTSSRASAQFLIHNHTVIGPFSSSSASGLGFWRFPEGGAPVRTISTSTFLVPVAEALSLKNESRQKTWIPALPTAESDDPRAQQ
jgi:hypothetical protein